MICSVCCDAPEAAVKTQFLTGYTSSKKETIQKHAVSNGHMRAQKAMLVKQKPVGETTKRPGRQQKTRKKETTEKCRLRWWWPTSLQRRNCLSPSSRGPYPCTKRMVWNLIPCMPTINHVLKWSPSSVKYSRSEVRATNAGGMENETVFCWFVWDGQPINHLIGHKSVEHADVEGRYTKKDNFHYRIMNTLRNLQRYRFPFQCINTHKCSSPIFPTRI